MSHVYRCNRCRTRNTFTKAVNAYVRKVPACWSCGHTRFYVDKERLNRKACRCSAYHYPHRPTSGCCERSPNALRNQMLRAGETDNLPELVILPGNLSTAP